MLRTHQARRPASQNQIFSEQREKFTLPGECENRLSVSNSGHTEYEGNSDIQLSEPQSKTPFSESKLHSVTTNF